MESSTSSLQMRRARPSTSSTSSRLHVQCARFAHAHECSLLCVLVFSCWFVRVYGWRAFAQASVYRSHRGGYPAPVDSMRINTKPKMWWVTSRQLPGTFWVDEATERAIYSFSMRDTAAYPEQQYLDHGDLAEDYRAAYSSSTVPKGCIGKKRRLTNH